MSYVLLVEDDPDVAAVLAEGLVFNGHRCSTAGSGQAAAEFLQSSCPDVVIVDRRLPDGSGLDVARHAVAMNIPVIVTSADHTKADEILAAGFFFLAKPFSIPELLRALAQFLASPALD